MKSNHTNKGIAKTIRRGLASLLILILLAAVLTTPASSVGIRSEETLTIGVNASGLETGALEISTTECRYLQIPIGAPATLFFRIRDWSGETIFHLTSDMKANQSAAFPLPELEPGDYSLDLYVKNRNADGKSTYQHLVTTVATRTTQGWVRKFNEAFTQNQSLSSERTDWTALQWFLNPSSKIQSDDPRIVDLALSITASQDDPYEKALAIHDWVCNNIYYYWDCINGTKPYPDVSATTVLTDRMSICSGYANLTAALLRAAGIPAKVVTGYAKSISLAETYPDHVFTNDMTTNHAWVEFFANGRWIVTDTTWDSGNSIESGVVTKAEGCDSHLYFDPSPDWFAQTHTAVKVVDLRELTFYLEDPRMYDRVNGTWHEYSSDGAIPYMDSGSLMIPLYSIVRFLNGSLEWDEECNPGWVTLRCRLNSHYVNIFIGYPIFYVDGQAYSFSKAPVMVGEHVRIDAVSLLSAIGCDVQWAGTEEWMKGAYTATCEALLHP